MSNNELYLILLAFLVVLLLVKGTDYLKRKYCMSCGNKLGKHYAAYVTTKNTVVFLCGRCHLKNKAKNIYLEED